MNLSLIPSRLSLRSASVAGVCGLVLVAALGACSSDDGGAGAGAGSGNDTTGTIGDATSSDGGSDVASSTDASTGGDVASSTDASTGSDVASSTDASTGSDSAAVSDSGSGSADGGAAVDAGSSVDGGTAAACAKLDEGACKNAQGCVAIYGADPCTDGGFGPAKTYAGCLPAAGGCGQAFSCGEKDGVRLSFSTTCQPAGWTNVGSDMSQCCKTAPDPATWGACAKDADCAVFQTECCDHCNGGKLMAVNKTYLDAAKAKHGKTAEACANTACTLMACGKPLAVCNKAKCVPKVGDL